MRIHQTACDLDIEVESPLLMLLQAYARFVGRHRRATNAGCAGPTSQREFMMSLDDQAKTESSAESVRLPQLDEMPEGKSQAELGNLAMRDMLLADPRVSIAVMVGSEPNRVLALLQPPVETAA
jgi:hypothetical protein